MAHCLRKSRALSQAKHAVRRFCGDECGIILPYVTVMLVALIGLSVLALDGARYMELQTQLQNRADAIALAAAAELDRTPTSIDRARRAIATFGDLSTEHIKIASMRFLSSLPLHDSDPILPAHLTNDPTRAGFVEITLEPVGFHTVLPATIFGGSNTLAAGAQAVAGFDQAVCSISPVFICNPFETEGMSYAQATQALVSANTNASAQRQLIKLSGSQALNRALSGGDFGYLVPATGSLPVDSCGPPKGEGIGQALAASQPAMCFRLSGVSMQSADDQTAMDGLNTRFDIYANGFQQCKNNYVADVNVRKGYVAPGNTNWCAARPATATWPLPDPIATGFPLDQNMLLASADTGTQVNANVSLGNGTWDCLSYWHLAHFAGPGAESPPPGCTQQAKISRYSVYQYEMNYMSDRSQGGEYGDPQCNPLGIKYRRVIKAAIVNCGSNPEIVNHAAINVPVAAFGKLFLTLPAPSGSPIYAEFLGLIKPGDPNSHDMVQLYR